MVSRNTRITTYKTTGNRCELQFYTPHRVESVLDRIQARRTHLSRPTNRGSTDGPAQKAHLRDKYASAVILPTSGVSRRGLTPPGFLSQGHSKCQRPEPLKLPILSVPRHFTSGSVICHQKRPGNPVTAREDPAARHPGTKNPTVKYVENPGNPDSRLPRPQNCPGQVT